MAPPLGFTRAALSSAFLYHRERLHGKGFVQLDHVDLAKLQTSELSENFRYRKSRANAHFIRRNARRGKSQKTSQRLGS